MDRKVIVFGATGNTGAKICEELESLDISHSAFVRKGSETKIKTQTTKVLQGDVLQKSDVENALKSEVFTDVIIALGSRDLKGESIRSSGTRNIVEALNEIKLKCKTHVISAHGVGDSWDRLKWFEKLITKLFLAKTMQDHELQESFAKSNTGGYHIIRPVALKNGTPTGNTCQKAEGFMPKGDIDRADVAKFLVESMMSEKSGSISICRA